MTETQPAPDQDNEILHPEGGTPVTETQPAPDQDNEILHPEGETPATETQPTADAKSGNHNSADVWKATEYPAFSFLAPTDKPPAESPVEKRAIWIVHGMGQQVPFETLDSLFQGIQLAAENDPKGWRVVGTPRAATAKFLYPEGPSKTQVVQRVEVDLKWDDPAKPDKLDLKRDDPAKPDKLKLQLHVYEAYWAPLTEGVAKVSEVMSFLFNGGLHGLLHWWRPFRRAMFPDDRSPSNPEAKEGKVAQGFWNFHIPLRSGLYILAALLLVAALMAIDTVIAAASAAHLKASFFGPWVISSSSPTVPQLMSANWNQLTAIATAITALALTFGAVLFLAEMSKPAAAPAIAKQAEERLTRGIESLRSYGKSFFKPKSGTGKTEPAKTAETADRIVFSLWASPIRYLSWISLYITAGTILIGAVCLVLISWFSKVADWFHGMHYHATQFVSTAAIFLALVLCVVAAVRRAFLRSQGIDYRQDAPRILFISAFLLHIALLILLVLVQFHPFSLKAPIAWLQWLIDPETLATWQREAVDLLGSPFWVWPALIAISKLVRDLIVEYPGDVAIYVTSNKLDRFDEIRDKIKQVALDSLMPLYSACNVDSKGKATTFLYSKVAVVGHSLGSVVAYDTLNKLLTLDELLGNCFRVAERTAIFETFGSPLDKTAFFFSFQGKDAFKIREQLAASKQPLIESYRFRKFPWINVHSSSDIISGELKFYDVTGARSTFAVQNFPDPAAIVPLIAHVEYWKNRTVWEKLLEEITRPVVPPAPAGNVPAPEPQVG